MYSETQPAQNKLLRCLRGGFTAVGLCQAPLMGAAETGSLHLPLGYTLHFCLLLICGLAALLIGQIKLELQVHHAGLSLRFFPYKRCWQHIGWKEMRYIRVIAQHELPSDTRWNVPGRGFTHLYWLANPKHAVIQITLINNTQLYLSCLHPNTLLHFLEQGVRVGRLRS